MIFELQHCINNAHWLFTDICIDVNLKNIHFDVQWLNVVGLVNMVPLGDKNAPLLGAPSVRAYLEQFVKKLPKNLNK